MFCSALLRMWARVTASRARCSSLRVFRRRIFTCQACHSLAPLICRPSPQLTSLDACNSRLRLRSSNPVLPCRPVGACPTSLPAVHVSVVHVGCARRPFIRPLLLRVAHPAVEYIVVEAFSYLDLNGLAGGASTYGLCRRFPWLRIEDGCSSVRTRGGRSVRSRYVSSRRAGVSARARKVKLIRISRYGNYHLSDSESM